MSDPDKIRFARELAALHELADATVFPGLRLRCCAHPRTESMGARGLVCAAAPAYQAGYLAREIWEHDHG